MNKVETRVEVRFNVLDSMVLSDDQKKKIAEKGKLNSAGELILARENSRSQSRNKEIAIADLCQLIRELLFVPKRRKQTKPSRAVREKRLSSKKKRGEVKKSRKKPSTDY